MALDKAIQHGKEHRKPYTGGKAIDRTCRNHGSCDWCKGNRYMLLMYRKKLPMRSWQNMRKEGVDEKVVLYLYVVSDDCIWDNRMHIQG